jgi:hypothetical protein
MAGAGPVITFFGVAGANDTIATPIGTATGGIPIYRGNGGFGFSLVVEARPGISNKSVGQSAFRSDVSDPTLRPDLQIEVSRPLGDGSTAVCDSIPPMIGGIPAINPPNFAITQVISDALNDFACRFLDGSGRPSARGPNDACTVFPDASFAFVCAKATNPGCTNGASIAQYCGLIARPFAFMTGDTLVTVQVLDTVGNSGPPAQLIIRN